MGLQYMKNIFEGLDLFNNSNLFGSLANAKTHNQEKFDADSVNQNHAQEGISEKPSAPSAHTRPSGDRSFQLDIKTNPSSPEIRVSSLPI